MSRGQRGHGPEHGVADASGEAIDQDQEHGDEQNGRAQHEGALAALDQIPTGDEAQPGHIGTHALFVRAWTH